MDQRKINGCTVSTDKTKLNVELIHSFLTNSYWAKGIPFETIEKCIRNSLCFGVYLENEQVGFARVISDFTAFAYLADVFIIEKHRGKGLSKLLMKDIITHPELQGLRRFVLGTRDAHGLYRQFGFKEIAMPDRWMEIINPDVYVRK